MSLAEYGDLVMNTVCPKCRKYGVVYNGNYFCENYAECGWAMSENPTGRRTAALYREITWRYLKQRRIQALVKGDIKEAERMDLYLSKI